MDDKTRDIIEGLKIALEVNRKLTEANNEITQELIRQLQPNSEPQQQRWRQKRPVFRGNYQRYPRGNYQRTPRAIQYVTVTDADRNSPEQRNNTQ